MKKTGTILICLGALFTLNALVGRYLVLPGFLNYLEAKSQAVQLAPTLWGVTRYMIWAFSFKLGVFFLIIGASLLAGLNRKRFWLFVAGGILYVALAYVLMPTLYAPLFGLGGWLITLFMVYIIWHWARTRPGQSESLQLVSDLRMIGYFFLVMATYNLCPLCGVSAFALTPAKMIQYGRESMAVTLASHILIELVLGWFFLFLSHYKQRVEIKVQMHT